MELTLNQEGKLWKLISSIFAQVADLDVSAAYPTNEVVANISQETTFRELGAIEGVSEETRRAQGINLSGGHSNAVEFCVNMFGVPDFMTLLDAYEGRAIPTVQASEIPEFTLQQQLAATHQTLDGLIDTTSAIYPDGYLPVMDDELRYPPVADVDRDAVNAMFEAATQLGIDPEIIAQTLEYATSDVEENAFNDEAAFT